MILTKRNIAFREGFHKHLQQLCKRDKTLFKSACVKIIEIMLTDEIAHYKHLRAPMQKFQRVHIIRPFVMIFYFDETKNLVIFSKLDHHDKIYQ